MNKPFHDFGVFVRTEYKGFAGVELLDCGHVVDRQCEVEHVEVLGHTLDFGRFRYDDYAELHQEAQCHLGHALAVKPV